jgi:hypothetical protein
MTNDYPEYITEFVDRLLKKHDAIQSAYELSLEDLAKSEKLSLALMLYDNDDDVPLVDNPVDYYHDDMSDLLYARQRVAECRFYSTHTATIDKQTGETLWRYDNV